jgi:hypothetical protein
MTRVASVERTIFRNAPRVAPVELRGPIRRDQPVVDLFTPHEQERLRGVMDDREFIEATTPRA